jgi:hypothetical protein
MSFDSLIIELIHNFYSNFHYMPVFSRKNINIRIIKLEIRKKLSVDKLILC